ncbi:hypothetical protein SDJN02_21467 [Cucurbita argyrosperma subsp. argyrosperma]|nr:hypothetical protein SDJN02_21467 [Cucurbita argyrosperma subsp. argyrosperma]
MSSQIVEQDWRDVTRSDQPFSPDTKWAEEEHSRILSMKLPGFPKNRLQITLNAATRTLTVTGQKQDGLFNIIRLNERISIDDTCSLDGVFARLHDHTLFVTFSKKK